VKFFDEEIPSLLFSLFKFAGYLRSEENLTEIELGKKSSYL
jgi:hypothetical protein